MKVVIKTSKEFKSHVISFTDQRCRTEKDLQVLSFDTANLACEQAPDCVIGKGKSRRAEKAESGLEMN